MKDNAIVLRTNESTSRALKMNSGSLGLVSIPPSTHRLVLRMFANPSVLANEERDDLVKELRDCVALYPAVPELRVVLGMALCVNLEVQEAMEELAEAVSLAPDSFMAHLKMGELWMRLRVCSKAKDHTHYAVMLAENMAQSELARRQETTIRTLLREGVDRSGYRTPWLSLGRLKRLFTRHRGGEAEILATVDAG